MNKKYFRLSFLIIVSFFINNCSHKNINYESGADLIIEKVIVNVNNEDSHDQTGMPVRSGYKTLEILLTIKNVGSEVFNSSLFIGSTNSQEDYQLNYFNSFSLVEPGPTTILQNESLEIVLKKRVNRNLSGMKFRVNYHSDQIKVAKEINYFNNSYSAGF